MIRISTEKETVIILLSGGVDSTALVDYYLRRNYQVTAIHFQYNQRNSKSEREAVLSVCRHYDIEHHTYELGFPLRENNGEYMSRNILFILAASTILKSQYSIISLGIHYGSPYYDCSEVFLKDCQNIMDGYFAGAVSVEAPFLNWSKIQIYEYCIKYDVPFNKTYSCERDNFIPCGECLSCLDREMLYEYK
ncbi:7-cyano-7-deazaguanine synthase [Peribacillus sp. SCS-37]|uniref:7-cyano-7-deazaguanine synthase n=1 Tax=Paraperibacillus esterisolvens TaxID=3115296 RepID=UPI0039069E88